jgi:N-acetylglutamate synthase-like GNAT family acetyltransferase
MSESNYRVRRATIDDLPTLTALWGKMHLPAADLERRLTEFQVAETAEGTVAGAIGLEIAKHQGRLHSEAFEDFSQADVLRQHFWERLQTIVKNHGLARLWTQESAPFWNRAGFAAADATALEKLPPAWSALKGNWVTVKLMDEAATEISLDKEFAIFKEMEKEQRERTLRIARVVKVVATILAVVLAVLIIAYSVVALRNNPRIFHH